MAAGKGVKEAAAAANVSERTAVRRNADPVFRKRVADLRSEATCQAVGKLASGAAAAADKLRSLVDAEDPDVAFKAAKALLELTIKLTEFGELAATVAELKRNLELQKGPR